MVYYTCGGERIKNSEKSLFTSQKKKDIASIDKFAIQFF